ncbi:unnamed protein product, partial [Effrenium voratum]
ATSHQLCTSGKAALVFAMPLESPNLHVPNSESRNSSPAKSRTSSEGRSPRSFSVDAPVVPVAQWRSHKLEPIILQPKTPRPASAGRGEGGNARVPEPLRGEQRQAFRGAEDQRPSGGPRPRGARSPGRGRDGRAQVPPGPPGPPGVRQGVQGGHAQGAFGARPEPRPGQSPSQARSASGARTSSPGSPGSRTTRSRRAASTRRDGSQAASKADGAYQAAPPKNRIAKYGGVKKGRTRVSVPAPAFRCLGQAAAGIREMDWNKLYRALEILTRFLIPCESVSLYLVEEGGRYLRR